MVSYPITKDDHVVFFFGAGISKPTFKPDGSQVGEITQKVLEGPLVYTENKRYVFPDSVENSPKIGRPHGSSDDWVEKVRGFLGVVNRHAESVHGQYHREVTYEDLYALCGEVVSGQEEKNVDPINPAIRPFSEVLRNEAEDFLLRDRDNPPSDLFHTANEATFLISGVVRELLSESVEEICGLDPLRKAIEELDRVTIVTLNHDLLLEQFLKEHDINFDDGFEEGEDGVRRYNPERLFEGPKDVTVIKPHGSINWYVDESGYISLPVEDPLPSPDRLHELKFPEPSILSGYRKEERYATGIFGDMVDALLFALHDTSTVIESGFGWTDSGMYNHLFRYLRRSDQNQLLLLHSEDDFELEEGHPLDYSNSFRNPPDGLIRSLPRYLSETSWSEMKAQIDDDSR